LDNLPSPPPGRAGWPWTTAGEHETERPGPAAPADLTWPRITVITPSFNQADFLEETIRSVLLQAYPNLEYWVVDGGSTDGSLAIIQRYAPWLAGYVSEPDRGQSHAINKGLARATGAVLAWLNSDDTYEPGALAHIGQRFAAEPRAALIYGQAYLISRGGRRIGQAHARDYDRRWLLEQANCIPQPSAFFSRAAWLAAGPLDETLHFAMDYDLWLRLGNWGPVQYVPEFLSNQRIYPQAKTSSGDHRHYREVRQVILQHGGDGLPASFARWLADTHLPLACEAYRSGDLAAGCRELGYVLENVPAWRAAGRLAPEIARWAWSQDLGLAGHDAPSFEFAERVCQNLPVGVANPAAVRRQVFSALHKASAFRHFARRERAQVWRHVGQTLAHNPAQAQDRGLWSAALRSLAWPRSNVSQPISLEPSRQRVLAWLEQLPAGRGPGRYSLTAGASEPSLEASALAAQTRAAWGAPPLSPGHLAAWTDFLLARRTPPDTEPDSWRDTVLAITAVRSLGGRFLEPLGHVQPLLSATALAAWLAARQWALPRQASRQVRLLAASLVQEHARTGAPVYRQALEATGDWIIARVTADTGFWTFGEPITQYEALDNAGQLMPLLARLGRLPVAAEEQIARLLNMQHLSGLFGVEPLEAASIDLAAVSTLAGLSQSSDFRAAQVRLAMAYALRAILPGQRPDGGFGRGAPPETSDLLTTWQRSLTLAIIGSRWPDLLAEPLPGTLLLWPDLGAGPYEGAPAALAARP